VLLNQETYPACEYSVAELRLVAKEREPGVSDVSITCDVVFNRPGRGKDDLVGPYNKKQMGNVVKDYYHHFKKRYGRWIGGI